MRNDDGTFAEGNPGRPLGARNKLSKAVIEAWCADVEEHGPEVIERLRTEDPATYARISASLVSKDDKLTLDGEVGVRTLTANFKGKDGSESE